MKTLNLIKLKRQEKGLTQMGLAVQAGVSLPTVQNLESGKGNPTLSLLEKIYMPLSCTIQHCSSEPDWSLLKKCGLPLEGIETKKISAPTLTHADLAKHLNLAITYTLRTSKLDKRLMESLSAMVWAIYEYYPSFHQYCLDTKSTQSLMQKNPLSGRIIKLRRMTLDRLSKIL